MEPQTATAGEQVLVRDRQDQVLGLYRQEEAERRAKQLRLPKPVLRLLVPLLMLGLSILIMMAIIVEFSGEPVYEDNDLAPPASAGPSAAPGATAETGSEPVP